MYFGNTLKEIRQYRGYTQKELGILMGFKESTADVRIAQYEAGTRFPKEDGILKLAEILKVQPSVLTTPDIPDNTAMTQLIMALDEYPNIDLDIEEDGTVKIKVKGMEEHFKLWREKRLEMMSNELPEELYTEWLLNWQKGENI